MAENTPGGHDVGTPVRATDPEGRAVTYRLSGRDASAFTLDEDNGQLRTRNGVDYNYEVKNRYAVTVEAADEQCGRPGRRRQNGDSDHDAPYSGDYLHPYGQ